MPGWGETFKLVYSVGEAEIAASGMQRGQAMCAATGPGGPGKDGAIVINCEYLTAVPEPRGYAVCRDSAGGTYRLLF